MWFVRNLDWFKNKENKGVIKMKNKVLTASLLTGAFLLAACGGSNNNADTGTGNAGAGNAGASAGDNQTTVDSGDMITLTYANWNLATEAENNIERRLIAAFMEEYPHINIQIDESITGDWTEALSIAASTGSLPDVFMLNDTAGPVINGWLYDLSEMASNDPEFNALPDSIKESTKINGTTYSVPFAQFMLGFYVNRDLFNNANLNAPEHGISVDDFISSIRQVTDLTTPVIGLNSADSFVEWMPAAINPNMGFFTFDGSSYHLDSTEMIEAIRVANELTTTGFTYSGLSEDQRSLWVGENDIDVFVDGGMAAFHAGTWMNHDFSHQLDFDWDFIGSPGGRPTVTLDIVGIASTTSHPEEAYLFAKWMGYGEQGTNRRFDIAEDMGIAIHFLPVTGNQQVLDRYWGIVSIPGMIEAYNHLDNALIDGNKIVPGHVQARFLGLTGIQVADIDNAQIVEVIHHSIMGNINFPDHASVVNQVANQEHQNVLSLLN